MGRRHFQDKNIKIYFLYLVYKFSFNAICSRFPVDHFYRIKRPLEVSLEVDWYIGCLVEPCAQRSVNTDTHVRGHGRGHGHLKNRSFFEKSKFFWKIADTDMGRTSCGHACPPISACAISMTIFQKIRAPLDIWK